MTLLYCQLRPINSSVIIELRIRSKMNYFHIVVFLHLLCLCSCESYKILAIFPMPSHSHYEISSKLLNGLARRGHQVTVYTPFLQKTPVKNLKEILITSFIEKVDAIKTQLFDLETQSQLSNIRFTLNVANTVVEEVLKHEEIQKLFKTDEEYDVILLPVFLHESLMSLAHHFKKPAALLATKPLFPWTNFILSHPSPSSYVPNHFSRYTGRMDFWQRLTNSFYDTYAIWYHQFVILPQQRKLVKEFVPGQPDLYDFMANVSLVLINSHISTCEVVPHVPNTIEIGGFHIEEPKKLPEELQQFLDDSVNGAIVFSLGSNLKSSQMPSYQRDEILRTFSKLKQNVLWKWEMDNLPGQPKNVKIMKWIPQSDILAHPHVRAFITHGGLLSTMESIYYGVPIIGIPFFVDQRMNMATAVSYGYGVQLSFHDLSEEKFTSAITEILNNPKYTNNARNRSNIMRDRPMKPLDTAIYWIEYIIRHQGAPHLRYPGMDLAWYQRNLFDVVAFVIVTISIAIIILKKILKQLYFSCYKEKIE